MTRRLAYLLWTILFLFVSCAKQAEDKGWDGPVVEITVMSDDLLETKAEGSDGTLDGIDNYNENLISWVDFFFYPGGNINSDAVYHVRMQSGRLRSHVFRLELSYDQVNSLLFPSAQDIRNVTVLAVANWPEDMVEDEEDLSGTSLPELGHLLEVTDFAGPSQHIMPRFLMSGTVDLALRGRTQVVAAAGTVKLTRYASKLTVGLHVADQIRLGEEVWTPMYEGMELYLVNGVNNVSLAGEVTDNPSYFSYKDNSMRFAYKNSTGLHFYFEKEGDFYTTFPMYMYPQHWDYGSDRSPRKEPYLKLVVPWMRQADPDKGIVSAEKQFYYKIVIPEDRREEHRRSFVRNNWYHVNIVVGILGSDTDDAGATLDGTCYIYDWQDKNVVVKNAEIGNARYLSVERTSYTLYNIDRTDIAYVSSHPISITDVRATRPYYGTAAEGSTVLGGKVRIAGSGDIYPEGSKYLNYDGRSWLINEGDAIVFDHPLNNNYADTRFDYSPYTVSYTIAHTDRPNDESYRKSQVIVQYPAIYLNYTSNPDTKDPETHLPIHWGYVYVDGEQYTRAMYEADPNNSKTDWQLEHIWRVVHYSEGGTDMYNITPTVLPPDSEFIIGDPRQDRWDNLRNDWCLAPDIETGENRRLQYYYPTEASNRTVDMIAPSFRISTKYSGTEYGGTPLEQARYRCASFQENGFPAGRWRLPTRAEVRFASQLSANGVFEWQFSGTYWSAQGAIFVDKTKKEVSDSNASIALIRCVYDTWYWGDSQLDDISQFTWADKKR